MDIYREIILDHYKNPRNFGHLHHVDASAEAYNATCGDKMRIEIQVKSPASPAGREKFRRSGIPLRGTKVKSIQDIRFSGEGCAISQASASMLTEKVKGMSAAQIQKLSFQDVQKMLGVSLTPSRVKCATLPLEVLQKAISSI